MAIGVEEPGSGRRSAGLADSPFLSYGFRPFFMLSAAYAVVAMALWLALLVGWTEPNLLLPPVAWHVHEMLFGFAGAGLAGFLLTAVPSWTGQRPAEGWPLLALALLWLAGRLAVTFGNGLGVVAALVDLVFLPAVLALVAPQIVAARNRRNYVVVAAVALLVAANALTHVGTLGLDEAWAGIGERLAMHVLILLIALIGGRIVPAFTGNWLARVGRDAKPAAFGPLDLATLAVAAAAAAADTARPGSAVAGLLLVAAGALHLVRLGRWRGVSTLDEPLVWVLHLGYLWLALGSLLLGLSGLTAEVPRVAGVHALTAGAIGTMLVAVMTRASLGHTGRPLVAGTATLGVYALVTLAAVSRVAAPWWPEAWFTVLVASASLWIAAFGLFFAAYLPIWTSPRADRQ